ncbi:MAG: DNA polymerase I [Syntrophomonadaceae bacterium]|nr:DNA polymerase I [Syntrophomonadaceae bacterium]
MTKQNKLMLIDGNSLLYRAFYALPLLQNSQGLYTNGVYGFLTMFNRVVAEQKPTHIVVAFDMGRITFRNEVYSDYKAHRQEPPDELTPQFSMLREVLTARNVDYVELAGYEADDLIGTLSRMAEEAEMPTVILTGDGDSLQLVSDLTHVLMTKKGITQLELYDPVGVKQKWEVEPDKMIEIKALMGDASDNIPGVPGIGAKTAVKLIKEYGILENLYEHLDEISGKKLVEKLSENRDLAFTSRYLATIVRDIELDYQLDDFAVKEPEWERLLETYRRLGFNSLISALQIPPTRAEQPSSSEIRLVELQDRHQADRFIAELTPGEPLAIYIQADYHHPMWANLLGIYLAKGAEVFHLALAEDVEQRLGWLRPVLEAEKYTKYLHNAKFVEVLLLRQGIRLEGVAGDTLLAAYIDDPSFDGDELPALFLRYLNMAVSKDSYPILVSHIHEIFKLILERLDDQQCSLLQKVEMPLSRVLAAMEFAGIQVDAATLAVIGQELEAGIERDQTRIYELAGGEFNINSPRQLGQVLFEQLGLRTVKKTKTGYGTGAEVLEELYDEHEIIPFILDYRQITKLKSTYVDALQGLIQPQTGRVHTIFKQAQTATGRLSSVEPNLQNIPMRLEEGRRIRRAFTSDHGRVLLSADYSQIDLRSLAHISGDEILIESFRQNVDIHTRTAAEIFDLPIDKISGELRRRAKAVNFGIIYGISDFGLARDTGVSRKEARVYIDNYLDGFPGVKQYMEDIVAFGQKHGYVETILGRRRYLPDLNAKNKMVQSLARRMALNTPIQGTSADIIKLAMIKIYEELQRRHLKARLLLQVHDDVVLELPREELDMVAELVRQCMENAYDLKVPLVASLKVGDDWYDMREHKVAKQGVLEF